MTYALLAVLLALPCVGPAAPPPMMTLPGAATMLAAERGLDVGRVLETIRLESDWDASAVGDEGAAIGLMQFHAETWSWGCELTGHEEWADPANRYDPLKSLIVGLDMVAMGYGYLWTAWEMTGEGA